MANKLRICVFGASTHGQVISEIALLRNDMELVGFIDSVKEVGERVQNVKVIGRQVDLPALIERHDIQGGIVGIGDNYKRAAVVSDILTLKPDFNFVNLIHPNAYISPSVTLGVGNAFMPGTVVHTGVQIHNHCIVNTHSNVDHFSVMRDYSSLGITMMGGYVDFGRFSATTLGVTIFDRIKIGENVVIGSGSLVTKDVTDNVLIYGSPARVIRTRKPGESFLL